MTSSLPAGPAAPHALQGLRWTLRPIPFMESCARRYGSTFTISLPGEGPVVFTSDTAAIKQIFTGDPSVFHAGEANKILEPLVGRQSVLLLDGPSHLRQRKLLLPPFHGRRMQRYGELMAEITERDMESWPLGRPFALRERTQAITLEIVMRAVFGIEEGARLELLRGRLRAMLDVSAGHFPFLVVPALRRLPGGWNPWRAFERASAEVDELLFDEIARRRSLPGHREDREDVLSLLLGAVDELGEGLSDRELRDELMTLLVAGHETTATALAWAWERLLRRPDALERLHRSVAAGEDEYLDAVAKEALRLKPVIQLVVRKLKAPITLAGHDLPAGVSVAPCIYLTHRRADLYPDPAEFRPERFLERPADTYEWIPFGGGIRRCIGASFALYEMKVVMRAMVERAALRAVGGPHERPRRRSITSAPERDTMVVLDSLAPPAARPVGSGRDGYEPSSSSSEPVPREQEGQGAVPSAR